LLPWKTFLSTFIMVFLAELGDKTQLSTVMLASHSNSGLPVFLGASLALVTNTFLGVCLGTFLSDMLPTTQIHIGAGIIFIIIGILLITQKI